MIGIRPTHALVTALFALGVVLAVRSADVAAGLIGQNAREWHATNWLNSPPLTLAQLRGHVVLVRWWTSPGCRYCTASAPALNEFHREYAARGLKVIGLYHHKSETPFDPAQVRRHARRLGFEFPVATDPNWKTLKKCWLDRGDPGWTSVSFLIDGKGVIRHIHPGGQYVKGDADYAALKGKIEELLKEE